LGESGVGVQVYLVAGKKRGVYVCELLVYGGELADWGVFKSEEDVKAYYSTHGKMGEWC
jgi:hypothetical protein